MAEKHQPTPEVVKLIALQEASGLSQVDFAEQVLGISQGAWSRLRNGQRHGSGNFIRRALQVLADPASFLPAPIPNVADGRKTA